MDSTSSPQVSDVPDYWMAVLADEEEERMIDEFVRETKSSRRAAACIVLAAFIVLVAGGVCLALLYLPLSLRS